ncbi:MAG TPA: MBL fold metallo-hydrolase [Thermoanaerobaculia bacterium]|jgi:glyoxylase-like metal-dependent hydrolase (beta-lactamase superfamily II)
MKHTAAALLLLCAAARADDASLRAGTLPRAWNPSGPKCIEVPQFQVHAYNEDFVILRQSGCTNYEKPFLFLLFGKSRALLLDTGAGGVDVAREVRGVIDDWRRRTGRDSLPLVVAHSHAHGDHIAGDAQMRALPGTTVVEPTLVAVSNFFGFTDWPNQIVPFDLGARVLDIIPIPGHEATSIAVYDRQTGVLLTGDTLYPGRLYVHDGPAFIRSIRRLVTFTDKRPVAHILGCHIENTRTPFVDYPVGTVYQPDEHELALGRAHLLELDRALQAMGGTVTAATLRDFSIRP